MGLDISAITNLRRQDPQPEDQFECDGQGIRIYVNPGFVGQADELTTGMYDGEWCHSFRAGSYSGYNEWRNVLCQAILGAEDRAVWENLDAYVGQPCIELINFSDCEGVIGPKTSAKLYQDFLNNRQKFVEFITAKYLTDEDGMPWRQKMYDYDIKKYDLWTEAFKIASENNGAVKFH